MHRKGKNVCSIIVLIHCICIVFLAKIKARNVHCYVAVGLDQTVGFGLVMFAASVFVYYTAWVIVLPFVEPSQSIHAFFLPRTYAVALPLIAGVVALSLIGAFVAYITMKPKKAKSS